MTIMQKPKQHVPAGRRITDGVEGPASPRRRAAENADTRTNATQGWSGGPRPNRRLRSGMTVRLLLSLPPRKELEFPMVCLPRNVVRVDDSDSAGEIGAFQHLFLRSNCHDRAIARA